MISLRPHHVLCAIGYRGEGYSDAFTANMSAIVLARLRRPGGDDVPMRITTSADAICAPCPRRRGMGCVDQAKINGLDARHGAHLGLKDGDLITWGEARDLAVARTEPADLDRLCQGCEWLGQGMCKEMLASLKTSAA